MNPLECKHNITIDFETFYTSDFSLAKMTTQEYVLDDQFEVICVAVKLDNEQTKFCWGDKAAIQLFLKTFPWEDACLVAHNAMFDAAVLEWHFGIKPKAYYCTMMGARPNVVPYTARMSLAKVAEYYDIGAKGSEIINARGKRRVDFNGEQRLKFILYCINDVDLCHAIHGLEIKNLPTREQHVISLTVRKFVRPQVKLDIGLLEQALAEEQHKRKLMVDALALKLDCADPEEVKSRLMSNAKFAQELRNLGVEPPMKISPTTGKETYAFAKKDLGFQELQDHPDPMVQALVATRLGVKSTQMETRLATFIRVAKTAPYFAIPLLYYGAHTGRFSGLDGLNLQNLPRGSVLREAIHAIVEGWKLIAVDLSQIEARITALIAMQRDLVAEFAAGEDVYSNFASALYGYVCSKSTPVERFVGKQCILGLGFGLGPVRFADDTNAMAKVFGLEMEEMTEQEAKRIVRFYRNKNRQIVELWDNLNVAIEMMAMGQEWRIKGVPCIFMDKRVILPNGCQIHYPDLKHDFIDHKDNKWEGWSYKDNKGKRKRLYGGALLENIVQALARIVLTTAETFLADRGLYAAFSVHDELIYCAALDKAPLVLRAVEIALTRSLHWCPTLPLETEGSIGDNYKECK